MDVIRAKTSDSLYFWLEEQPKGNIIPAYEAHEAYEIYILFSGERYMYLGNSLYHIQRGSAVMISPDVPHRSFGAAPYSGICIEFSDKYIDDAFSSRACASIRSCFRKQILTLDENALDAVYANTVCAKSDKREENRCLLNIMNILRGFSASGAADNSLSGGSDMSNIGYYLQTNYLTVKSLDELTERFGLSKSHLCRVFKQHTGVTITHYINALRIQHAYKLISETNIPIKDVYVMCGYRSSQYFGRVFKKIYGCSPRTARNEARKTQMWEQDE